MAIALGLFLVAVLPVAAQATTVTVCPSAGAGCQYVGGDGIQQAVDAAPVGTPQNPTTILIKNGTYTRAVGSSPLNYPTIKCFIDIDYKNLLIRGESVATILNGAASGSMNGICVMGGSLIVNNMTIKGFIVSAGFDSGYGIHIINTAKVNVYNNVIVGNAVEGVLADHTSKVTLVNNTIYGNSSGGIGCNNNARCALLNNLVIGNRVWGIYGISNQSFIAMVYNDAWNNLAGNYNPSVNWPPPNNLSYDPQFVDAANGDFHLKPGSPAINTGYPNIIDADGSRSDLGAYGGTGTYIGYNLDFNQDNYSDYRDFKLITQQYNQNWATGDLDFNGKIDVFDMNRMYTSN